MESRGIGPLGGTPENQPPKDNKTAESQSHGTKPGDGDISQVLIM